MFILLYKNNKNAGQKIYVSMQAKELNTLNYVPTLCSAARMQVFL